MATESSDSTSSDSEMPPGTTYELTRDNGETFELSFVEEPLGIGKDVGYGYVDLQFGERIGPEGRYEILRKLGYGRSSSVWLARDHEPRPEKSRFVAIKCYTGHVTDLSRKLIYFEDIIMSTIESRDLPTGLDAKHCLEILDVFGHEGGSLNAEHQCIVTEVMGGDAAALREVAAVTESKAMSLRMAKRLLLHTLKSLTMLHSQSIVHTDLKLDNVMFDRGYLSDADIEAWVAESPSERHPPERSVDSFVTVAKSQPLPLPTAAQALPRTFVLADFGQATAIQGFLRRGEVSPIRMKAPEVLLGAGWDCQIDIWMFGCMLFECLVGGTIFNPNEVSKWDLGLVESQLWQMLTFAGKPFPRRLMEGERAGLYLNADGTWKTAHPPYRHMPLRILIGKHNPTLTEADVVAVETLCLRCFRLDPAKRPTAAELLLDPWWTSDLEDDGEPSA